MISLMDEIEEAVRISIWMSRRKESKQLGELKSDRAWSWHGLEPGFGKGASTQYKSCQKSPSLSC